MTTPARTSDDPRPARSRAPRADAQRNVAAILDAARECLVRDPEVTVAEIARRAGVGRVTLYGHFPTRADLVDAVFQQVSEEASAVLDAVDTGGEPADALTRLVESTWRLVHPTSALLVAAERELSPERIRGHHGAHLARMRAVVRRGRETGAFRTDLPEQWLVTTAYALMHAAAEEVQAGRLDPDEAGGAVVQTLLAAYTPRAGG